MRRPLLFLLLAAPSVALAVPSQLTTQGRVLDEDGDPVLGTLDVTFRVLDSETEGSTLWEETQAVALTNGFYSVVLGADESGNPLEDATLDQWPLWLEVQIDGEPAMAPRMSIGSVPYARMAGMSEELQPGASLDVESLSVGGNEIIANDGSWTGTTPDVFWEDLLAVPADFADEDDADTLANLSCSDGQWAMFDAVMGSWVCDGFSDTTLSAAEITAAVNSAAVDLYVGSTLGGSPILTDSSSIDWSALTGVPSGLSDGDDDSLAALSCSHGQWAMFDVVTGSWGCNGFSDTTLSAADITAAVQAAAIDLYAGSTLDGSPILTDSSSIDWSALTGVPSGLSDGDDDSLAALSCSHGQWAMFDVVTGSWGCNGFSDTTLSAADITAAVQAAAIDLYVGSTLDGSPILTDSSSVDWSALAGVPSGLGDGDDDTLAGLSCAVGWIAVFDGSDWVCGEDTTLSASDVSAALGSAAVDLHGGSTVGGSPILTDSSSVDWSSLTGVPSGLADGDDDSLAALSCSDGQWAMFDIVTGSWGCDGFTDTTLSAADITAAVQAAAIDLYVGSTLDGSAILTDSSSVDWSALAGVPSGLGDGDDDTLAGLSCAVGWITVYDGSSWVCGEDATLSEAEVEAFITDDAIDLPAGSTVDGAPLSTRYARLLDADEDYWCALDEQGLIHCSQGFWGQGALGQVIDATSDYDSSHNLVDICALDSSGELSCHSVHGTSQPVTGSGYIALAGDEDVGCVLSAAGAASCWGGASLSGTFTTIEGTSQVICGLSTTGALVCDYPGRSYNISEAGPWDWVDARKSTVCAGESTGSTYCWNNTSASVTRYGVAGSWAGFSGAFASGTGTWVYGCGVLSSGTLRCVLVDGSTVDHAGSWLDALRVRYGWDTSNPPVPTAITADGVLFDPTPR